MDYSKCLVFVAPENYHGISVDLSVSYSHLLHYCVTEIGSSTIHSSKSYYFLYGSFSCNIN